MDLKYLLKIITVFFLILSIIILINILGFKINEYNNTKNVLYEGLENNPLTINNSQAFCESHKGFELETSCNSLTKDNCNLTSCCIWSKKCRAGNKNGALFNSDSKGKTIPLDYYYFQNKCYGDKCK